jgi:hypothetical protein
MTLEDVRLLYEYNRGRTTACSMLVPGARRRSSRAILRRASPLLEIRWCTLWVSNGCGWSGVTASPPSFTGRKFPDLNSMRQHWTEIGDNVMSFTARIKPEDLRGCTISAR